MAEPFDLFYLPFRPALDANGIVVAGASLTFYASGTSTLEPVFADAALTTALANPLTANSAGVWPPIYINTAKTYRVVLRDGGGAPLNEIDPYVPGSVGGLAGPAGPAFATFTTLTQFKAGPISNGTQVLLLPGQRGTYTWKTGNFSSIVNDRIYIASSVVASTVGAWVQVTPEVSILDCGGIGDYNRATGAGTDNTPAFLTAIATIGPRGGRITIPDGFLGLIATSFRLPEGFSIVGEAKMVGINNGSLIPNYGSALYIDPAVSITIASGTRLSINLLRRGLQFQITSAQVAATFLGKAVILEDYSADHIFENMMILGFGIGVQSQTIAGTSITSSRTRFVGAVGMDNQIDVHIHNAADVPTLAGIHGFIFVTDRSPAEPNGLQLIRTGPGIWLSGLNDWTKLMVPFNYGRKIGYRFTDTSSVKIFAAGADYPFQSTTDGSVGFQFDGETRETTIFGGQCAQHDIGCFVDSTANEHAVTLIGCDFWENRVNAVGVKRGQVQVIGGRVRCSYPGANGIQTAATAGKVRVIGVDFRNLSGVALANDDPNVDLKHEMCTFNNVSTIAINPYFYQKAAVDPLPLDGEHSLLSINAGVPSIGTVLNVAAYEGKVVTLYINTTVTLARGGSFVMAADQACVAGDVLTFLAINGNLRLLSKT